MASAEEEERDGANTVYKMKVVQFFERSVPIILQNDNGPCPLLAISNVLLLKNELTLEIDRLEISQRHLMTLVAGWLLDHNTQNQDDEFAKNQQRNIQDAIQLLPRLATGIDVNVRFRHIHDFEYTPECAIFDLFHVGLVHGWLCDPQDEDTFKVIGSNSYNILVEKLVAFHAIKAEQASRSAAIEDEQPVDFAAATIAALGVPTPHMKIISDEEFEAMNQEAAEQGRAKRRGDEEEEAELFAALQLSQGTNESVLNTSLTSVPSTESGPAVEDGVPDLDLISTVQVDKDGVESVEVENAATRMHPVDESVPRVDEGGSPSVLTTSIVLVEKDDSPNVAEDVTEQDFVFTAAEPAKDVCNEATDESELPSLRMWLKPAAAGEDTSGKKALGAISEGSSSGRSSNGQLESLSMRKCESASETIGNEGGNGSIFAVGEEVKATVDPHLDFDSRDVEDQNLSTSGSIGSSFEHVPSRDDKLSMGTGSGHLSEEAEDCASSVLDEDEPLYEGEQRLVESGMMSVADKEPLYEGEGVSAELPEGQVSGQGSEREENRELADENLSIAMTEGLTIENFLSSTASQLTYHGLFSLQDGLQDNELYVFFRNNHFSTLFKYDGQIYLLATDQGYLAQPDLVWEKLTEVDGDTFFATGTFHQFQVEQSSGTWNERDAMAATADFLSSQQLPAASTEGPNYKKLILTYILGSFGFRPVPQSQPNGGAESEVSDLQLAMALQQQELREQQPPQQQARPQSSAPRPSQPSSRTSTLGAGRLVTGPPRSSAPPQKPEKAKEKCTIM